MRVALLADHIGAIDMLAAWYEQEWGPYYGDHGPGDAAADLASRCNRDRLPAAVVGLLVVPEYRRKGFAGALLDAAGQFANELGYDELFMSTSILGEFLKHEGWLEKDDVEFMNSERGKVYVRSLSGGQEP